MGFMDGPKKITTKLFMSRPIIFDREHGLVPSARNLEGATLFS